MIGQLERAKEIFIEHLGSYDSMAENGCLEEYLQYNVPADTEYAWAGEIIEDQFKKAESKCIRAMELISSVCFVVSGYGRFGDYKRLLAIKDRFLSGADILELNLYFDNVLGAVRPLPEKSVIADDLKLEIVTELEKMVAESMDNIASIPDRLTGYLTQKYSLQAPKSGVTRESKLNQIYDEVITIKNLLLS